MWHYNGAPDDHETQLSSSLELLLPSSVVRRDDQWRPRSKLYQHLGHMELTADALRA
jgi:hypothetical protein